MARTRVSTTVDSELLARARLAVGAPTDAALLDQALASLLVRMRAAEIDASYVVYENKPLQHLDEWGDLAAFREAAATS